MKGEVIFGLDAIEPIEKGWRALAIERGSAFISPEWFRAWAGANGDGQRPAAVVVRRDGGELAGVMPLAITGAGSRTTVRFAGAALGDRFCPAAREEDEGGVAEAAMRALEESGNAPMMTILHRVDQEGTWPTQMAMASARRLTAVEQSHSQLPYAVVEGLDWEAYLQTRSQKFRQRVGRGLEKALDRDGISHVVRETTDARRLAADLQTLFRLHDLRRDGAHSSISASRTRDFLAGFAAAAFEQGWLRLRILELDGRPAAAYLGWRIGSRYAIYQSGFDPAWADRSAGMLLLNDTVRSAIAEDAAEIDMLLGEEAYKVRFATGAHAVRTTMLVRSDHPARALVSAEAIARRRGRKLARRPRVGPVLRSLSKMTPGGRG